MCPEWSPSTISRPPMSPIQRVEMYCTQCSQSIFLTNFSGFVIIQSDFINMHSGVSSLHPESLSLIGLSLWEELSDPILHLHRPPDPLLYRRLNRFARSPWWWRRAKFKICVQHMCVLFFAPGSIWCLNEQFTTLPLSLRIRFYEEPSTASGMWLKRQHQQQRSRTHPPSWVKSEHKKRGCWNERQFHLPFSEN